MNDLILRAFDRCQICRSERWMLDSPAILAKLRWQIQSFPAFALPAIDDPAVFCGVAHEQGVGEAWMIGVEGYEKRLPIVRRQQHEGLKSIYAALGLHRLHMMTDARRPAHYAYATGLGFEYETTLRRYGPRGEDVDVHLWPEGKR
jgi:hypothetical protein